MIILIHAGKACDKTQHPCMVITLNKVHIEETYLNIKKSIFYKLILNIIFNDERLKIFPLRSGTTQGHPLSSLLFNIVPKILVKALRQKKNKRH